MGQSPDSDLIEPKAAPYSFRPLGTKSVGPLVIGTLDAEPPHMTCSYQATEAWGKADYIKSYHTFEDAAEATRRGEVAGFTVPCAYPAIGTFIMDERLTTSDLFISTIPALVAAGTALDPPQEAQVLFCHPAVLPLLPELPMSYRHVQEVRSNPEACTMLLQYVHPDSAAAVTNETACIHFGLTRYKTLRRHIAMPFLFLVADS